MANEIKVGRINTTGAAVNISIGWKPDHVRIVNETSGTRIDEFFAKPDGTGTTITVNGAAGPTKTAANGVSHFSGPGGDGFTIGTAIATAGATLAYVATRNGE